MLCGVEKPELEDGDEYEPTEDKILLLRRLAGIVLDGPNVNKGALKEFEKKHSWVACIICVCHCLSNFFKNVFKLQSVKTVFTLASNTGNKFRRCKWLREQCLHTVEFNPDIRDLDAFKTGISSHLRHVATRFASKHGVLERAILMNPVAKVIMSSPKYPEKYEDQEVDNNIDSDDE